ncbi:MAG: hypothetical protein LUI12_04995 [Clostridiales bacterium]|nr:hypothetical protein [Clostridiales bacterium]
MKVIMLMIDKTAKLESENAAILSLFLHTLVWFILGGCAGGIWAVCRQMSSSMRLSCMVTAASLCALVVGYLYGMVYLLRRGA